MTDSNKKMMRKFGLIGYPLGHSFSKKYFTEKFDREKIGDVSYDNYPLEDISLFEPLYKNDPELSGLNVTIPYKESVIPYLDILNDEARKVGAVNTICLCTKTGRMVKVGFNTDVVGFRKSLEEHLEGVPAQALVLGTGGASRAVVYVLKEMGIQVVRVSSSGKDSAIAYHEIDDGLISKTRLIVNTTPLGMHPDTASYPPIPYEALSDGHLLFDLVYNPEVTMFMKKGEEQGARTVNGYDMLVYQAEEAWRLWNR
jgi:shikimate dehydrogenase